MEKIKEKLIAIKTYDLSVVETDVVLFPEKVTRAKEMLAKYGLPKEISGFDEDILPEEKTSEL
jgi:hypothetical protein